MVKHESIDDYIDQLPENVRERAKALRLTIMKSTEGLVETIRYDMPAFRYADVTVIYFAFWKKHVGLYPIYRGSASFEAKIGRYRAKTDTVQFPLNAPIQYDLVTEIVSSQLSKLKT